MGCYLCIYEPLAVPAGHQLHRELSSPQTGEEIGICARCSVAACTAHGARHAQFECAICEPARAAESVMLPEARVSPAAGAATALAESVGATVAGEKQDRIRVALEIIRSDAHRREEGRGFLVAPSHEREPNLVANLAGVIREQAFLPEDEAERNLIPKVQVEGASTGERVRHVSIEAISAAVAATFADADVAPPDTRSATDAVLGAVLLAMSIADARNPTLVPGSSAEEMEGVEIVAPWQVTHPVLLDPVMWMILTAYQLA
jgi:hypothetical protein